MTPLDSFEAELLGELRNVVAEKGRNRSSRRWLRWSWAPVGGVLVAASVALALVFVGPSGHLPQAQAEPYVVAAGPHGTLVITAHRLLTDADLAALQKDLRARGVQATVIGLGRMPVMSILDRVMLLATPKSLSRPQRGPSDLVSSLTGPSPMINCAPPTGQPLMSFKASAGTYTLSIPAGSILRSGVKFFLLTMQTTPANAATGMYRVIVPRRNLRPLCDGGDLSKAHFRVVLNDLSRASLTPVIPAH